MKIKISYILFFLSLMKIYGQDFDLLKLENQITYKTEEIRFIFNQVEKSLINNIEKTEIINNLLHRVLFYKPRKFLKNADRMNDENFIILLKIIENPLNDKYNVKDTIKKIEIIKFKTKTKQKILESLKKI